MRKIVWITAGWVLAGVAAIGAAGAAAVVGLGLYNVSAAEPHLRPTYALLEVAMRRSIARRAADIVPPPLDDPAQRELGLRLYRDHCVQCHGAPGVAPLPFALAMRPAAANLAATAREWPDRDLYWTVRYGIKMSGMPAWEHRMTDDEMWAVVAFLRMLPELSPQAYQTLAAKLPTGHPHRPPAADGKLPDDAAANRSDAASLGDPARGRRAIEQYACNTCHRIPGIVGSHVQVGPPLDGMARRHYLAGRVQNTPEQMVRWLRDPQAIAPKSAMPDLGVTERDARDIAAFLFTLD